MHLSRLQLTDFRSYPRLDLEFGPGATALVGFNGVGKTNIVEALGYFATLSSHRVATDGQLLRTGAEAAYIRGEFARHTQRLSLELELIPGKSNRARINRANPVRAREILGLIKTVLFAPEDLSLIKGDPSVRRRYLDEVLAQETPANAATAADYERVLKQRNALLKSARGSGRFTEGHRATLEAWNEQLISLGIALTRARAELAHTLAPFVAESYRGLTDGAKPADIVYISSILGSDLAEEMNDGDASAAPASAPAAARDFSDEELEVAFRKRLEEVQGKEVERGISLVGPHRDDVAINLAGTRARGFASHGETWSLALSLRLAALEHMRSLDPRDGMSPILILDDVLAELDRKRRDKLTALIRDVEQVIITAAVREDVPETLGARIIEVTPGEAKVVDDAS